jgi:multidrug efflux pump
MQEEGLGPLEATVRSMGQITGALIGIALVLSAVFLPMAFFPGSTGVIYRQFSVTIISAMVLSALVALILTPALCASFLRHRPEGTRFLPARVFNRGFEGMTRGYAGVVGRIVRWPVLALLLLGGIGAGAWAIYGRLDSSFLPAEDQGVLMTQINLSEGSTIAQTQAVVEEVETYLLEQEPEAVESTFAALGFGLSGSGQGRAMLFVKLRDWDERQTPELTASAVAERANEHFGSHRAGRVFVIQPPAIQGLGSSRGFSMYLVDQSGAGTEALRDAADQLVEIAENDGRVTSVRASGTEDESALRLRIDQQKAESFGLSLPQVNAMLSVIFAGRTVNDFALGSELRPVIVQGEAEHRMQPEDIEDWYARNGQGEMVPFASFMSTEWTPRRPLPQPHRRPAGALHLGLRGRGHQLRRGDGRHGGACGRTPGRLGRVLDRTELPGAPVGQPGALSLRAVGSGRVPLPRGPL